MLDLNRNPMLDKIIAQNNNQLDEWERANDYLEEEFNLSCSILTYLNVDMRFMMFPYSDKDFKTQSIAQVFKNRQPTYYAERNNIDCSTTRQSVKMHLDEIPPLYNYLDIYFMNILEQVIGGCYLVTSFISDKYDSDVLFSYQKELENEYIGLKIGTFAKINSKYWKFYPIFNGIKENTKELLIKRTRKILL